MLPRSCVQLLDLLAQVGKRDPLPGTPHALLEPSGCWSMFLLCSHGQSESMRRRRLWMKAAKRLHARSKSL